MSEKRVFADWADTNLEESKFGVIDIDNEKCNGCTWCQQICPAQAIAVEEKKARMVRTFGCMFCGCCQAICPEDAVIMKESPVWPGYFTIIDRGGLKKPRMSFD